MRKLKKIEKPESLDIDVYFGKMLENIIYGKEILKLQADRTIFSQGADADAIYFIQSGRVKITTSWGEAKHAILAIFGPCDFFGEGCLIGHSLRINTATTTEPCTVFKIQKDAMLQAIKAQPGLSEKFIASLIIRNIDVEEDICNQLFNDVEKRLAHVLLKLNRHGRPNSLPDTKLPQLSPATLADMVGGTRPQISRFLNKFRRLGLIYYNDNGEIVVRAEMLADIVLQA